MTELVTILTILYCMAEAFTFLHSDRDRKPKRQYIRLKISL